jgi:hypothetical protein
MNPVHCLPSCFFDIHCNIILPTHSMLWVARQFSRTSTLFHCITSRPCLYHLTGLFPLDYEATVLYTKPVFYECCAVKEDDLRSPGDVVLCPLKCGRALYCSQKKLTVIVISVRWICVCVTLLYFAHLLLMSLWKPCSVTSRLVRPGEYAVVTSL